MNIRAARKMRAGGIATMTVALCIGFLADASSASDLASAATRLQAATSGRQLDAIVAKLDDERRETVARLVEILRGEESDATKVRACVLLGSLGDPSVDDALIANLDLMHSPYTARRWTLGLTLKRPPCTTALLEYGLTLRERLIKVIESSQDACQRAQALSILYSIASSQVTSDRAAQAQVKQTLSTAMRNASEGEKTMLESAAEGLESHSWDRTYCSRWVREEQPEPAPHLAMGELDRTAVRLRKAKSPEELDGITYGVEDQRRALVESLLALLETQAAVPVKARACYLLGQFHASGDKRLVENVALEWQGGRERYPCQEALARAWATAPAVVLGGLADEGDEASRGHLVDLMIGWYGGAGTVQRLTAELRKETGLKAARLKQALVIAEAYAKHDK